MTFQALQPVNQTFEILVDSTAGANRAFTVDLIDASTTLLNPSYTTGASATQLPAQYLVASIANGTNMTLPANAYPFVLDGRWLHAFNGTGVAGAGKNPALGNFKFNGLNPNSDQHG